MHESSDSESQKVESGVSLHHQATVGFSRMPVT